MFWVLPMVFILLNLFITPRYQITLRIGRVLQVYIVMSIALLFLLFLFNTIFLLMANSLNKNARLQQKNQFLSMQQQRYEGPVSYTHLRGGIRRGQGQRCPKGGGEFRRLHGKKQRIHTAQHRHN